MRVPWDERVTQGFRARRGQVICHLVKANPEMPPEDGTGWHKHECDFQIVIMTKGK
jgi:hypothetical protein